MENNFTHQHVFLTEDNSEEVLLTAVEGIKRKVYQESRVKAFEDCSQYWKEVVENILSKDIPPTEKLAKIQHKFSFKSK
jgi:hypothetical protein